MIDITTASPEKAHLNVQLRVQPAKLNHHEQSLSSIL